MEDKLEEIISQYPFHVYSRRRTRGAFLIETEQGLCLLKEYSGSLARLTFEEKVKTRLIEQGYDRVDYTYRNNRKEYFTKDRYRNNWILKKWFLGTECDIKDRKAVLGGVAHLGRLHQLMCLGEPAGEEYFQKEGIRQEMERHNKELKRVRSYIRGKKQKNEMEICLLNSFDMFYDQACLAQTLLQESGYDELWEKTQKQGKLSHGSYTYHNILMGKEGISTTNFDRTEIGIQVRDLYDFLRKVMEKNAWKAKLGMQMLEEYIRKRQLDETEGILLYAMLLFPEKYWKLVNFYYNSRKSWMSAKNLEKLIKIRGQEEEREAFLQEVRRYFSID